LVALSEATFKAKRPLKRSDLYTGEDLKWELWSVPRMGTARIPNGVSFQFLTGTAPLEIENVPFLIFKGVKRSDL
jgi:hypothetical protein